MIVTVDRYTRVVLTVLTVLLTVVAVGLWCDAPSSLETAEAKLPDAGLQFNRMIEELREVNANLVDLQHMLASGAVRVQVVTAPTGGKPGAAQIVSQVAREPASDAVADKTTTADIAVTEAPVVDTTSAPAKPAK